MALLSANRHAQESGLISTRLAMMGSLLAMALISFAQQPEPWHTQHFSTDARALYDAATAVKATEGTNIALLDEDHSYSFDSDGRMTHVGHYVYKILTQKGAEGWDSMAVNWEPWREQRPKINVRVISADGREVWLDPSTIIEEPARGGDYKAYSDGKRLRAPFPAIAIGSVVEEEFIEKENEPFFSKGHVGRITLGEAQVPVEHTRISFDAPLSLPLRTDLLLLENLKPVRTESQGRVHLDFVLGRFEGIDARDGNLPPDVARYPEVRFSTGASWQELATEYARIVDAHAQTATVQALVDRIVAGKVTRAEKIAALQSYVDEEVRYTGIEFGEAALVPHDPSETLTKKYGDCKDKATLLVTMLRAAGIDSYVALLSAGGRMDVPADLPGMGLFDHAIVYVAPSADSDALWIDATDQYARLGQLPIADQGRLALVARASTTRLIQTMTSTSKDNQLIEFRDFELSANGPAKITERTQPMGVFESRYRGFYADKPDKDMREGLTNYVKNQYIAEKLGKLDRTDPGDLSKQFELTLVAEKARRGYTDLSGAQAAIRLDSIFQQLPEELRRKDETEEEKKKSGLEKRSPRTADWWLDEPFMTIWHYRVVPPPGFVAKDLPQNVRLEVGPALLSENFHVNDDGTVSADLVFDTVKRRYTVDEATALRNKVADLIAGPALVFNFEPKADALLRAGNVKESLAQYRSLIAAHPKEAVYHLQLAQALLGAGMGEEARVEARKAVVLDPTSALAQRTLAEILKHDIVGRALRPGADWAGAAEAYRKAILLDADEHTAQANLAILLEYDKVGRRYSDRKQMKAAVVEYQKLGQDKLVELGLPNNLVFAQFYAGDPEGALKLARTLSPAPLALIGAAEAMLHGSKAGLAAINSQSAGDDAYKSIVRTAGDMLMNMREYELAADFFEAGAAGDNAAQTMGLASMLRGAPHHEQVKIGNTATDVVKNAFLLGMSPSTTLEQMKQISSRAALRVMSAMDADDLKKSISSGSQLDSQMARQESSLDVIIDISLKAFDPKIEGSDELGYRERVQIPGGASTTFYVVKENGEYKLLDSDDKPNSIAYEILTRIDGGDLKGAKQLLDWLREDAHLAGGDDPLGGPVFPRFWTKGQMPDARKMRLAAAAILIGTKPTVAEGVKILEKAEAVGDRERTNIALALAVAYRMQDRYGDLERIANQLTEAEPDSRMAFLYRVEALIGQKRWDDAMKLADARLSQLEDDTDACESKMRVESGRQNYEEARKWIAVMVSKGKENAELLNSSAWFALYSGKVTDADVQMAIRSTGMAKNNPHILHTLACLDAEIGKPVEAHDVLMRSMDELNLDEPNDDYWFALGRIAEQFGERDAAIADYQRLKKPTEQLEISTSSWTLAQMRLKSLGVHP